MAAALPEERSQFCRGLWGDMKNHCA